jgi:hemerythrin-like domain-containing protein
MQTLTPTRPEADTAAAHPAAFAGRRDLYAPIHKALRLFMTRTLTRLGAADPGRADEVGAALDQLERLLALCEVHLKDENEFVHPALERARPGSAARIAAEHVHHAESIADLRDLAGLVKHGSSQARGDALMRLYRALALFVADNFQHMHQEEMQHNAVLWTAYSDAQLLAIEQALVASIPPDAVAEAMHWFMPALNAPERALMLSEMQQGMPPEPFRAMLDIAQRTLDMPAYARLLRDLGLPVAPGLMTA